MSPENYSSDIAEAVVHALVTPTASDNLTTSEVNNSVSALGSLVVLQEKMLETGRNLNLSDDFVDVRLDQY